MSKPIDVLILESLNQYGPMGVWELAHFWGESVSSVHGHLLRLRILGVVRKLNRYDQTNKSVIEPNDIFKVDKEAATEYLAQRAAESP